MLICGKCIGLTLVSECDFCDNTGYRKIGQCLEEVENELSADLLD